MKTPDTLSSLDITIVQAPIVWGVKNVNLDWYSSQLEPLAGRTDLVVLPEMFATGFITDPEKTAEAMDGSIVRWMADTAKAMGCVVTGSVTIREKNNYYNRLVWMLPDGSFETADKRHLFRMGNEHLNFSAGNNILITELKGWKIRPLICYDLRFPVWSKNTFADDDYAYDLLIYVANWPASRSYVWKSLLVARAIENMAFCAGVNRIGDDGHGLPHSGDSAVLDFKGREIVKFVSGEPFIKTVTLDYGSLYDFRSRFAVGPDWDQFTIAP